MDHQQNLPLDPERAYREPRLLVESDELSVRDKLSLLESWRTDLIELQKAAEENMPSANVPPGTTAAKLAEVNTAISIVRERIENAS